MTGDEIDDLEFNGDTKALGGEVRRLNALLAEKDETIHRLNDKLDAALGGAVIPQSAHIPHE